MKRYITGFLMGLSIAYLLFILKPELPMKVRDSTLEFIAIRVFQIKGTDDDKAMAITRAHGLNMAIASFIQAEGQNEAEQKWLAARSDNDRFQLIRPFLTYSPPKFSDFKIEEYVFVLTNSLSPSALRKVSLFKGTEIIY